MNLDVSLLLMFLFFIFSLYNSVIFEKEIDTISAPPPQMEILYETEKRFDNLKQGKSIMGPSGPMGIRGSCDNICNESTLIRKEKPESMIK